MTGNNKTATADSLNAKFLTYDLGLAAALVTLGYNLYKVDKIAEKKSQFIFNRDEHIDKMVGEYWDNKLTLPVRSFYDNLKMLKNRLYSVIE
jgi:hypothetical protein